MKFEHIIHIYWTKGFFYGGNQFYFNKTPHELIPLVPGVGTYITPLLIKRFELTYYRRNYWKFKLKTYEHKTKKSIIWPLNLIFSQINSVNNISQNVLSLKLLKLYLIKSYAGRSHFLGKPVHGQRTWSNAWSAYHNNRLVRILVSDALQKSTENERPEKINYKLIKKRRHVSKKNKKKTIKKLKWF
jgi:hypothetical protein